ncbi:MAG: hypothetical protein ACRDU0_15975, partial [Mycobacterium sp.]
MLTLSAFQTTMPFLPTAFPSLPVAPRFCLAGSGVQAPGAPDVVPSTMTPDRLMPRRWMPGVVITT